MARTTITGIDIGTSCVKVIITDAKEKTEKGLPKILGTGIAESRGLRHGYVTNVRDVTESVRRAVLIAEEKSGTKVKQAFVGVGGIGLASAIVNSTLITSRADAEITDIDIKKIEEQSERDLPQTAIANRRVIYNIPLQYKIDGVPTLGNPNGLCGNKLELKSLFITCLDHHVANLIQAVNEAGIKVEDVVASPIAAGFVVLTKAQKIAGCVLSNIGSETVSIAVFENNIPTSLEVFPIGSTDITNDIALGLRVPLEEAEQIKIGAITGSSYPRKKLEEIIAARLSDIFDLIEVHLKRIGRNGLLPAGIVITGGGAGLSAIDTMAKVALRLPSRIGSINTANGTSSFKDATWAVAYGLCIWGMHNEGGSEIDTTSLFFINTLRAIKSRLSRFLP